MEEEGKTVINNNYSPGANCQVFNGPVCGCVFAMPGAHVVQQPPSPSVGEEEQPPTAMDEQQGAIVEQVASAFYGEKQVAKEFLDKIQGMTPKQITETVKQWVADGRISEMSKNRSLWKVLHENGLYPKSEPNWNYMLRH